MKRTTPGAMPTAESGFLLLEAVVAVALVALVSAAVLTAVLDATRASAAAQTTPVLASAARNVLTDVRAATAYDAGELAALAGRSTAFDLTEPDAATPIHVQVAVRTAPLGAVIATVSVRDARGRSVVMAGQLSAEAPAPGSVVPADP